MSPPYLSSCACASAIISFCSRPPPLLSPGTGARPGPGARPASPAPLLLPPAVLVLLPGGPPLGLRTGVFMLGCSRGAAMEVVGRMSFMPLDLRGRDLGFSHSCERLILKMAVGGGR